MAANEKEKNKNKIDIPSDSLAA
jgi:hypothetical protein